MNPNVGCEIKRSSPMKEAIEYLINQVDTFDSNVGKLIYTVQQPQNEACEAALKPEPAAPCLNIREQIFKAATRLEKQNAIFVDFINSLENELGSEKILK